MGVYSNYHNINFMSSFTVAVKLISNTNSKYDSTTPRIVVFIEQEIHILRSTF
jgi:hypothetical protein